MGRGGAERVVSVLSKYFVQRGNDVVIATMWFSENEYQLDSRVRRVSVGLTLDEEVKGRIYKALARLRHLRGCIKREKPDIVISFCAKANFRSAFAMIGNKTPLLVSVRNNPETDYAPHKLSTWLMERKASGCVFQTQAARAFFSKELLEKSRIIFNPIEEAYLMEAQKKPVEKRKREIVNVGRICAQKNQMLLLRAFAEIVPKYPELVLKIYGDVQEKEAYEKLEAFVRDNALEKRVLFMGVSTSIIDDIREAGLFVLSSDFEGMPNALIEAMALGLPVISTDCPCGGSAQLIENGKNGLLTPVGDVENMAKAMDLLLADEAAALAMGNEARKILDKVNPENICSQWLEYCERIIK